MDLNLQEVKDSFITTTRDLLQTSEAQVLDLEHAFKAEHFVELMRAFHTIKGNAGIFELEGMIALCHVFETFLENLRKKEEKLSAETIDLCLNVMDRLRALLAAMDEPQKLAGITIDDLVQALKSGKASPTTAQAASSEKPSSQKSSQEKLKQSIDRIRMPEKYLEAAKSEGHYLLFLVLDFGDQGDMKLNDFSEKLQPLQKTASLLALGVLRKESITNDPSKPFLPYYLIVNSKDKAEEVVKNLGIKVLLSHYLWQPEASEEKSSNDVVAKDFSRDTHVRDTHLKVHLDLLNSLIDITGEIVLTRNALVRKVDEAQDQALSVFSKKLSYLVSDLQDKVMKTRLQALDVLFNRFPRLVRETAQQTSKKAELVIEGGDIEIDKAIIDEIADPLVHIIRNAVDHGLETPDERAKAGKKEGGLILLKAETREGNIVIRVVDDGRGLDLEKIKNIAVSRGLISREMAAAATPTEISEYLFLPGFSTKTEVTTISGRGVGMDVVRTNVSKIGGSVDVQGDQGKGTTVTIVIPQTLSILTCLTVEVDGFRFVIPQQNIVEVVTVDETHLKQIQNKAAYELRQRLLPLIDTAEILEFAPQERTLNFIVVVRTEKYNYGLRVQTILDTEEVVVKPLPHFGQDKQIFSGAAIMGDGRIAPILDATLIGKQTNLHTAVETHHEERSVAQIVQLSDQHLLFKVYGRNVAFKVTSLPRIESIDPSAIETIVDRRVVNYRNEIIPILSMDFLRNETTPEEKLKNLIILQTDGRRYGLLAAEIVDIVEERLTLRKEAGDLRVIEGYALVKEETVVVLNVQQMMQDVLAQGPLPELTGSVA